jgi:pimeloyl-[acyl-carrier protein] synthase
MSGISIPGDGLKLTPSVQELTENPYPFYERLRSIDPVHQGQAGEWMLVGYAEVSAALHDHRRFSSRVIDTEFFQAQLRESGVDPGELIFTHFMLRQDPPDHTRLRGLVNKAFTPRAVERLRTRVQQIVDKLLDAASDDGGMDLIADFAYPLPVTVICELLGVPVADHQRFQTWIRDMLDAPDPVSDSAEALQRPRMAALSLGAYIAELAEARRKAPRDDLMSGLVAAEAQGERLSEEEVVATGVLLLIAGHETTANLIGNGVLALLRHPDQLERLKQDPTLARTAVEELLRFDSPVQSVGRAAIEDVELAGKVIRRGDLVVVYNGAANRDPTRFADPDRLDLARHPNRHLAFGVGIHSCVGAPLARLEGQIAIPGLFARFPEIRLASENVAWRQRGPGDITLRGLVALPLEV